MEDATIPDDVMKAAQACIGESSNVAMQKSFVEPTVLLIARAIMSERERAAKYHDAIAKRLRAESKVIETDGGWPDGGRLRDAFIHATSAADIRKGA